MFENMNPLDKSTAWLEIFVLMLGAFLIGYYFARFYYRKRYKNELEDCIAENQRLKFEESEIVLEEDLSSGIRAIKTRDRTGKPIESGEDLEEKLPVKPAKQPEFTLDNMGEADPSQKDDLTKIQGIGPFIEEKLNNLGIYTIDQISRMSQNDMDALNNLIEYLPNQIQEEEWVRQAEALKDGKPENPDAGVEMDTERIIKPEDSKNEKSNEPEGAEKKKANTAKDIEKNKTTKNRNGKNRNPNPKKNNTEEGENNSK